MQMQYYGPHVFGPDFLVDLSRFGFALSINWNINKGYVWSTTLLRLSMLCLLFSSGFLFFVIFLWHVWNPNVIMEIKVKGGGNRESVSKNWIPM